MKRFEWNEEKNRWLKENRGVSFEDIVELIRLNRVLDTIPNPNTKQHAHQRVFIVVIAHYIYMVPFIEDEEKVFLKTIYPSRKYTKIYLKKKKGVSV